MYLKNISNSENISGEYLDKLREKYPDVISCKIAIAQLFSFLKLPAGTNYYFSDIHAQGEKFFHVVNSKTGILKRKLEKVLHKFYAEKKLPELAEEKENELLKLCYYPRDVILNNRDFDRETADIYITVLSGLINLSSSKHSAIGTEWIINKYGGSFSSTIKELVNINQEDRVFMLKEYQEKDQAQKIIVDYFLKHGILVDMIEKMTDIIKELGVFRYVINGDIPDRGPDTARIIDYIMEHGMLGNWGNHDLLWMGAAAGNELLMLDLLRIQYRYQTERILSEDYQMDLNPIQAFVKEVYRSDEANLRGDIEKALLVIMTKLESDPEINQRLDVFAYLDPENFLYQSGRYYLKINDDRYQLNSGHFPTIDPRIPYQLTEAENKLLSIIKAEFRNSNRFQKHWRWIAQNWGMYTDLDGILSFHATVPMTEQGEFAEVEILGERFSGKKLFERLNQIYRSPFDKNSFIFTAETKQQVLDLFYRGWKGRNSWTFGKDAMTTFARYFIDEKDSHLEEQSHYYRLLNDPVMSQKLSNVILEEFCGPDSIQSYHIYNGHVPVKIEKGEDPIKANGTIFCGDGGFSKAYGDVGFALIDSSRGLYFYQLGSAMTKDTVLAAGADIAPKLLSEPLVYKNRKQLKDCNVAERAFRKVRALRALINEYQSNQDGAEGRT